MLHELPAETRAALAATFERHAEVARTVLLNSPTSDHTLAAFERDVRRTSAMIALT